MKLQKTKQKFLNSLERQALCREIMRTQATIDAARNHFDQVLDPTLIDCYIYELNAAQLRYQFLLRRFKSQEMAELAASNESEQQNGGYIWRKRKRLASDSLPK